MRRKNIIKLIAARFGKPRMPFLVRENIHFASGAILIILSLVFSSMTSLAQSGKKFSLGTNVGLFTNYENGTKANYGIDVMFEATLKDELKGTASMGVNGFKDAEFDGGGIYIPLLVGLKYQFADPGFYLHTQMGSGGFTVFEHNGIGGSPRFAYGISPGYTINEHLDVSVRYLRFNATPTSTVNLRVAWIF